MSAPNPSHLDPRNLFMAAAGAVLGVVLTPIVAPVFLGIVGFGAAGPIAGTAAAAIQAGIGNVAAGSLFATAQSVAMGGSIPTVITAIGAGVGAAIGAGAGDADDPPENEENADNEDNEDNADNADDGAAE
ncbi:hypothetical protein EDB92DRAFT_1849784 [Lactarius akahatsu]|uniref:Uncharacterized protein n=1 Tax=Lactarius akahatsu TaxID=416441 RepID=A0AAD4LJ45_9AGAM|nr:hypothetical protein EDB92DRAFT_1849784 [Lactarius akahatsu]